MFEVRVRTQIQHSELQQKIGKLLTSQDVNVMLTGPTKVQTPSGDPLCVYLPRAVVTEMEAVYPVLQKMRMRTDNRGNASGTLRANAGGKRSRTMPVTSGILGAMDPAPRQQHCRLTHYTRQHLEHWNALHPLLRAVSSQFKQHVQARWQAQAFYASRTVADWIVPGTVFTTITVNNSYATGVHTDKGDLESGFSCLTVGRQGSYSGGALCFPQYRLGVDMQHGDLLLMDAHAWHGNTPIVCACGEQLNQGPCPRCRAERISVVCYYRTRMRECGTAAEELQKREKAQTL
jgi:hypothetical protein